MTTDRERLAEARNLLNRANVMVLDIRTMYDEEHEPSNVQRALMLYEEIDAWLAHDDGENDAK